MTIAELFGRQHPEPQHSAAAAYHEFGVAHELMAKTLRISSPLNARVEAHRAYIAYRAERSELADPEPRPRATMACCPNCMAYRSLPGEAKPVPRAEIQ